MSGEQLCFHTGRMLTAEYLQTRSPYKLYNIDFNFFLCQNINIERIKYKVTKFEKKKKFLFFIFFCTLVRSN